MNDFITFGTVIVVEYFSVDLVGHASSISAVVTIKLGSFSR